jgi:hypothetical protein
MFSCTKKNTGVPKFKYKKIYSSINLLGGFPKHKEGGHGRDHPAY